MDDTQAHKIISALADGCDPTTGEKVEGSVLQHGDVIRALHLAVRALEANTRSKARSSRARAPANAGKAWTGQEDRELLEKFDAGQTVAQLAQAHDRTAAGIHARLVRHGRLQGAGRSGGVVLPLPQLAQFVTSVLKHERSEPMPLLQAPYLAKEAGDISVKKTTRSIC